MTPLSMRPPLLRRDRAELQIRSMLAERLPEWQVRGRLKDGGRSFVFAAERDNGLAPEESVIKAPRHEYLLGSHLMQFEREYTAMRKIAAYDTNHRIPRALDFRQAERRNAPVLVMERVPGVPLAWLLRGLRRLRYRSKLAHSESLIRLCAAVGEALRAAHRASILHNDVSIHNILVNIGRDGVRNAWLIDFGVSLELQPGAVYGRSVFGTVGYIPEGKRPGNRLDPCHDFWSLGLVLWHVATGKPYLGEGKPPFAQIRDRRIRAVLEPLFSSL